MPRCIRERRAAVARSPHGRAPPSGGGPPLWASRYASSATVAPAGSYPSCCPESRLLTTGVGRRDLVGKNRWERPGGLCPANQEVRRQPMRFAPPAAIAILVALAGFAADFPYWP